MSTCQHNQKISAYLDGELSAGEQEQTAQHLGLCDECTRELRQLRAVSQFLGGFEPLAIPDAALARIHNAVDAADSIRRMVRLAGSLATLAASLAITVTLWNSLSSGSGQAMAGVPAWEQAAVMSATNDNAAPQPAELAMAEWMVSDLSAGGKSRE